MTTDSGVATNWLTLEPDPELGDRVPHTLTQAMTTASGWSMVAASRRGKGHAHQGSFREDSFALGQTGPWQLMVVADGGGSCPLARVGSRLAAESAVSTIIKYLEAAPPDLDLAKVIKISLQHGLRQAWESLAAEAEQRGVILRDLGTTFLGMIHRPLDEGSLLGVVQVGDGLLAAKIGDKIITLAEPDTGEAVGSTYFLTSLHWKEWLDRVSVGTFAQTPQMIVAMCDGVADDFIPYDNYLPKLFDYLHPLTQQPQPETALLDLLGYNKRGSFDDRTLAMLYPTQAQPL